MGTHTLKYTGEEVDALLAKVDGLEGFSFEIVTALPTIDIKSSTIYLKGEETSGNNDYEEWIYVNDNWEMIGNTNIDLSAYATKDYVANTKPTKLSQLTNDSGFVTNVANDLVNYYLKTEIYTKDEVNNLIGAVASLTMEVVSELPTENISSTTIYLKGNETEGNNDYEEWIYVNNNWEAIGTTEIDLTGVALLEDIPTKLSQFTNDSGFVTSGTNNLTNYYKKSEVDELVGSQDMSDYATKTYVSEQIAANENAKDYTFHLFYDSENYNEETLTTNLLPTLNKMYQEYLAGKKPILLFVSDATFGMSAETGMYMINVESTDTAVVEFEQLNPTISWQDTASYTELDNCIYRIRGFLTGGVITSADWKTTGFSAGGKGYLATETYYSEPFMPTEEYQPATKKYVDEKAGIVEIQLLEAYKDTYTAEQVVAEIEQAFTLIGEDTTTNMPEQICNCYFSYDYNDVRLPLYRAFGSTWMGEETETDYSEWHFIFRGIVDIYDDTLRAAIPTLKEITISIKYDKSSFKYRVIVTCSLLSC